MKRTDTAKKCLDVLEKYRIMKDDETKQIVTRNFERLFGDSRVLQSNKDNTRSRVFMLIEKYNINTIHAWFSIGRPTMFVPLEIMLRLAEFLRLDINCLLDDRGDWREEDLTSEQIAMFEEIRKKQFFGERWWKFAEFAQTLSAMENYKSEDEDAKRKQLYNDVMDYFVKVVGYDSDEINMEIDRAVRTVSM